MKDNDKHPAFIGSFEFEGPGSPLSLNIWQGDNVYQFLTNFIGVYPIVPIILSEAKKKHLVPVMHKKDTLEEKISSHGIEKTKTFDLGDGEYTSYVTATAIVQFILDKRSFAKLDQETRKEFATAYKQSIMWDVGYLTKVEFEPWLLDVLKKKNSLDSMFKSVYSDMYKANIRQEKKSFNQKVSFIKKNYAKEDFEKKITSLFFKSLGYQFELNKDLQRVVSIFKRTKYSDDFSYEFFEKCKKAFGEKGISEMSARSHDYVQKPKQAQPLNRLKELLDGRELYMGKEAYDKFIKYQLEELFAVVQDNNIDSRTKKDLRKLISKPEKEHAFLSDYNKQKIVPKIEKLRTSKESLEAKIKGIKNTNSIDFDIKNQRMFLFLDIMHRYSKENKEKKKKIYFEGLNLKEMLSVDELLNTPIALFDIEKFQYGSIKEILTMCGTIIKDAYGKFHAQLDTVREIPVKVIEKIFGVKLSHYTKDLNKSIADFMNFYKTFLHMSYGPYDWIHTVASGYFKIGQAKKALPRKRVHEKFIERYEPIGVAMDLLNLMRIIRPHFLNHRLATSVNYLFERAGVERRFEKSYQHRGLTDLDLIAEQVDSKDEKIRNAALDASFEEGDYTVKDVQDLFEALLHPKNKDIFEDLLDVCKTFNITLDQACSNAGTVTNLLDLRYYERFGGKLSSGIYRQKFLELSREFKLKYTNYKTEKLLDHGLQIDFDRGIQENVSQLYFSPELSISKVLYKTFPSLESYVNKTLDIKADPERQVGRLHYLRALVVNMLTELYGINNKQNEVDELRDEQMILRAKLEQFNDGPEKTAMIKKFYDQREGFFEKRDRLGKKKWFFGNLFGVKPEIVNQSIQEAYKKTADVINQNNIHPLQIKGNYIYAKENIPDDVLSQAGLFRVDKDLTILNMKKNELTYFSLGQYARFPSRWEHPNYRFSQFELRILKLVLDSVFNKDYESTLRVVNNAANKISSLDVAIANKDQEKYQGFIFDLMKYNRERDVYVGVTGFREFEEIRKGKKLKKKEIVKQEFTLDTRHEFIPDLNYYMNEFRKKFFGLTENDIDVNGNLTEILGSIMYLGENNLSKAKKEHMPARQMLRSLLEGKNTDNEYLENLLRVGQQKPEPAIVEQMGFSFDA